MAKSGSGIVSGVTVICLLLSDLGVLAETDGNLATHRVVNGTLGQSITLPGYVPGESISITTWDYIYPSNQKIVPLCEKYLNNPIKCYRERITLNPEDYSLEIQNVTDSDKGFYVINARVGGALHEEVMKLEVHESVSKPVINTIQFISDEVCNISLHCSPERGSEPVYTWWTGHDEVTTDEIHVLTDGGRSLELFLRLNDNNTVYNCTVRNPVSKASSSVDVGRLCLVTEGQKDLRPFHIRLISTIAMIAFITIILFVMYWKREPKCNEGRYGLTASWQSLVE